MCGRMVLVIYVGVLEYLMRDDKHVLVIGEQRKGREGGNWSSAYPSVTPLCVPSVRPVNTHTSPPLACHATQVEASW